MKFLLFFVWIFNFSKSMLKDLSDDFWFGISFESSIVVFSLPLFKDVVYDNVGVVNEQIPDAYIAVEEEFEIGCSDPVVQDADDLVYLVYWINGLWGRGPVFNLANTVFDEGVDELLFGCPLSLSEVAHLFDEGLHNLHEPLKLLQRQTRNLLQHDDVTLLGDVRFKVFGARIQKRHQFGFLLQILIYVVLILRLELFFIVVFVGLDLYLNIRILIFVNHVRCRRS